MEDYTLNRLIDQMFRTTMPVLAGFSILCSGAGKAIAENSGSSVLKSGCDMVICGKSDSENAHGFKANGSAPSKSMDTVLGALRRSYPVRVLESANSSIILGLSVEPGPNPVVLEIEEIHNRSPRVFGYTAEVNGTMVYFRTYQEVGAGPNHVFMEVPRKLVKDGTLRLTLCNQGDAPVAVSRIWAYGDFDRLAESNDTWRPMPILAEAQVLLGWFGKPKVPTTEPSLRSMSKEKDPHAWKELRQMFAKEGIIGAGFQTSSSYLGQNGMSIQNQIDDALRRAGGGGVMWQYKFMGCDWGGHPSLLDGQGGDFYDIRYSQAVYNPVEKKYGPTWPKSPGGTIWPTAGEAPLNRFVVERSRLTARILSERIGLLAAQGIHPSELCFAGEEGPSYWWQGGYGDFSPANVAAAAKDGVVLDPANLTPSARRWMFDNLTKRFSERCRAIAEGLGRDIIPVDRGVVSLPSSQLADAIYSHPFMNQVFPLFDNRWEGWQNGANEWAWVSGEPLEYVNPSFADYIASQGYLAMVNLYRPILDTPYLEKLYQWGMRHIACYGEYFEDGPLFREAVAKIDTKTSMPARHYLRRVLELDFSGMQILPAEGSASFDNLRLSPHMVKTIQLVEPNRPGRMLLRLENKGQPLPEGLSLHFDFGRNIGRAKDTLIAEVKITAGADPENLQTLAQIPSGKFDSTTYWPQLCTADINLGDVLKGQQKGYVSIELIACQGSIETGLCSLTVTRPWLWHSGQLAGERPKNRQMRTRRLWMQDRAVVERLLARHRDAGGSPTTLAEAERLIASGQFWKARQYLSGAHSLLLPARFAVHGNGPLGPYPLDVSWGAPEATAIVELQKIDKTGIELAIDSQSDLESEIRCGGLSPEEHYTMTIERGNRIRISADPTGALVADAKGTIKINCAVKSRPAPGGDGFLAKDTGRVPERRLVAMCADKDLYEVQDPSLALYNPLRILPSPHAILRRGCEGRPLNENQVPHCGDRVEITLDDEGRMIEAVSTYGEAGGRIREFIPPTVYPAPCNGVIVLENGNRYEFFYRIHRFGTQFKNLPGLKQWARNNSIDAYVAVLKPGLELRFTYTPPIVEGRLPRLLNVETIKNKSEQKEH